ncbi:hypothetical protein B0O99DRAFT_632065 [Bisporella sp. PMI_857]|nr:hypothetical protein B0O99DRAFT_632065 [Bisporella sp. PMI_857]
MLMILRTRSRSSRNEKLSHLRPLFQRKSLATVSSFQKWRDTPAESTRMATPTKIHLDVKDIGIFKVKPQSTETAAKTSELLQDNHTNHHVLFNNSGFHNHIVHHVLSLYGVGAPASAIEKGYRDNVSYQRKLDPANEKVVEEMSKPELYKKYLGKGKHYPDFLVFWQNEMDRKGWENVLNEYLFSRSEQAEDLLTRLFAGFLHPLIHLGFGVEFKQPAIIAEALAQAAVHDNWVSLYLHAVEAATAFVSPNSKTVPNLIDEIRADKKLTSAVEWDDGNKVRDGILKRAPDEMIGYAKQWTVEEGELEKKTAEMIASSIWFTASAQRPPKQVKFDFFLMHCVNCSIFFPTFNTQSWLSNESKTRLLKFKVYMDLALYASRRSPALHPEEVATYVPKLLEAGDAEWPGLFNRLFEFNDDGHAIKLARTVAFAEKMMSDGNYDAEEWARIKGSMWEKVGNMIVDSVEDSGAKWVRSAGFEEAWRGIGDRPRKGKL